MYRFDVPFTSSPLLVLVQDELSSKELQNLERQAVVLVQSLAKDLNHRLPGSITRQFNELGLDFPIELPPHAWDFFAASIAAWDLSGGSLNPFKASIHHSEKLPDYLQFDPESLCVTKLANVQFDASLLLAGYILEQLSEVFTEEGIESFLLQTGDFFASRGAWKISFGHPYTQLPIQMEVANQFTLLLPKMISVPDRQQPEATSEIANPFQQLDQAPEHVAVILEAAAAVPARAHAEKALGLLLPEEHDELSMRADVGITLLYPDGGLKQFPSS